MSAGDIKHHLTSSQKHHQAARRGRALGLAARPGGKQSPATGGRQEAHPDVLQVLAVDRVDDAVGADELDGAVDVHVDHGAALAVLRARRHPGPRRRPGGPPDPPRAAPGHARRWGRDSQWSACAGPHRGAPRSGPRASAGTESRERELGVQSHGVRSPLSSAVQQRFTTCSQVQNPKSHVPLPGTRVGGQGRTPIRDRPGAASPVQGDCQAHRKELITLERVAKR